MQNYTFIELTLISAQDLRVSSSVFSSRLRPFVTVTSAAAANGDQQLMKAYRTRTDDKGGVNPTWGDKFQLPLDQTFFYLRNSGIYVQLYTKNLMRGDTQLGWCLIPAADIVDRLAPVGSTRFLSYRLRDRDGSRGDGVVNVAVKLEGNRPGPHPHRPLTMSEGNASSTVLEIPVKMDSWELPRVRNYSVTYEAGHIRQGIRYFKNQRN